ncbi:unnamed protein product [Brassica rapa]|uniref:Uncharacterized protein n=1 Tax=Brassica campestris TaxID=3711 RepID=A0A8D9DBH7_BRACM|nr:unnamed protein product [Brassica rapa]
MGECAKIGRGCTAMYGSVRTEHVKEALCNLRVLGEGPGRLESRRHQEGIKKMLCGGKQPMGASLCVIG